MAIAIWCEIVCNSCAKPSEGRFTYGNIPRLKLKKSARREGFVFSGDDAYCAVCAKLLGLGRKRNAEPAMG